jgi:hypothetical protein
VTESHTTTRDRRHRVHMGIDDVIRSFHLTELSILGVEFNYSVLSRAQEHLMSSHDLRHITRLDIQNLFHNHFMLVSDTDTSIQHITNPTKVNLHRTEISLKTKVVSDLE